MRSLPGRKSQPTRNTEPTAKPPLADVLEYYGARLSRNMARQKIRCVVHDDSSPSMSINLDSGLWKCHACHEQGDSYTVIQRKEDCDFLSALKKAEEITGQKYSGVTGTVTGPQVKYVKKGDGYRPKLRRKLPGI